MVSYSLGIKVQALANKKFKLPVIYICVLIYLLTVTVRVNAQAGDSTNLALKARVSTSFISSWENLSAVNDGYTPANSADYTNGAYGNWSGEEAYNTYNWVQYEWDLAKQLSSTSVYWWDDGQGIDQPSSAYIEYWTGTSWVLADSIGTDLDTYNTLKVDVLTSRIRIYMKSAMATGILEWRVFGIDLGPCDPTEITEYITINDGEQEQKNTANIMQGDSVLFSPDPDEGGAWSWSGPSGFTAVGRELKIRDAQHDQSGSYTVTYINSCGAYTTKYFHLTVHENEDFYAEFQWSPYEPTLNYDFRDEYPGLTEPQKILDDCEGVAGTQSLGWWTFRWGPTANPLVTSSAITPMLERMNTDFAYFRDVMGWPPDKRAKNGYKSAIYLYGSGLCTDDASNTDLGGWQSSIFHQGESWPMVLISYYPVYCFDPSCTYDDKEYQTGAVVHEGIHSVLADLPGCKDAAWFHEGGNTWLQQEADSRRSGDYSSMGFLNGASFIAPFMPIESYSGWLLDGSFGGPSAEGVNMFEGGTQICTWRNLLGGVQYSNVFPTFLGQTLGLGSVPWIWRYCPSRVLEGMADGLGDSQIRRLITEYRAKQALIDMGEWTSAVKNLIDAQFGTSIKAEWSPAWMNPPAWFATPYVETTDDGENTLIPEARTTPGWSGANQIPLVVNDDSVTVNFIPLAPNMTCQLMYRTRDGQKVYSTPVYGGKCRLRLDVAPANNVVFAVITNTDYVYEGEKTRKAHYDYSLQLIEGVAGAADPEKRWYDWTKTITHSVSIDDVPDGPEVIVYPNPVERSGDINIDFTDPVREDINLTVMTVTGTAVLNDVIRGNKTISASKLPGPGMYIIALGKGNAKSYHRIILR